MRLNEFGKGKSVKGSEFPILYHLTDYHGYSYSIKTNTLRTKEKKFLSTTYNPLLNAVGGRSHYDFKFVLNGKKLIDIHGGYHYDDTFQYVGSKEHHSHGEDEIALNTAKVAPLNEFLYGSILNFPLFSEKGIQWLLYTPEAHSGGFGMPVDKAPQAIKMIYKQLFYWKKPVWIGEQGKLLSKEEITFISDAHNIAKSGGTFKRGFRELADKYPIIGHWGEHIIGRDVERIFMSKKLVGMLNRYYQNRPLKKIDLGKVEQMLRNIIRILGLGSNIEEVIIGEIKDSGMLHQLAEPVMWGAVISDLQRGNVDRAISHIKFFARDIKRKQSWYDESDWMKKGSHHGTSFGRLSDM